MTQAFAPAVPLPAILPTLFELPIGPTVQRPYAVTPAGVNQGIDWDNIQAAALLALLLRAAYLDDERYLAQAVTFIPNFVSFVRLSDDSIEGWRPVVINCGNYRTVVMHGVANRSQYGGVVRDLLQPRYTAGAPQYLSTAKPVGDFLAAWFAEQDPTARDINFAAHSFGGVIGAYWASIPDQLPAIAKATYFGVPKLGPAPARSSLERSRLTNFMTREDPVIGLPPSFVRIGDVPIILAGLPGIIASGAATLIKRRLDAQWSVLQSASDTARVLNQDQTVGELANIDDGRNWYQRTGITAASILTRSGLENLPNHAISEYYNRLRGLFDEWTVLTPAAGQGGRGADVLALSMVAAELEQTP